MRPAIPLTRHLAAQSRFANLLKLNFAVEKRPAVLLDAVRSGEPVFGGSPKLAWFTKGLAIRRAKLGWKAKW